MTSEIQDMSRAVVCWLEYKSLTGMSGLFSEASLAVPIAEFLSRKHGNEIKSEVAHPLFDTGAAGRPRQLDFVREAKGENKWHAAFECKFQNGSLTDVVNDVCRLLCLSQVKAFTCSNRYFIFARKLGGANLLLDSDLNIGAGRQNAFDKIFLQQETDIDQKNSFKIVDLHSRQRDAFAGFAKKYKKPLPSKIVTKLCGMSQGLEYACAIWRITSEKGSELVTFDEKPK